MKRTIRVTRIKACAMSVEGGQPISRELETIDYTGRKLTDVGMQKLFKSQLKNGETVFIVSSDDIEKTYELSLEDFIKYATLVEE